MTCTKEGGVGYGYDGNSMRRRVRGLRAQLAALRSVEHDETTDRAGVWSAITALQDRATTRVRVRHTALALPLLAIGTTEQTVTWSSALPSDQYEVEISMSPALLGKATVLIKAGTQSTMGITLRITATSLISAGGALSVLAVWQG
ncbi:hypothetical protein [Streptosporangium sp. NPDC048865]|uniref:hypothetical protein n=1 Tax=Streptosporangium sp. NPDC048865 TaxID=3155766 RepID=UPI0034213C16